MKKVFWIVSIALLPPLGLFAETGFGVTAMYQSPMLSGRGPAPSTLDWDDFSFGGNLRFKLAFLQAETLALLTPGGGPALEGYLDGGLALDLFVLRLSAGVGPDLRYRFDTGELRTGLNAKANVDLKLGRVSFGLSYILALDVQDGISLDRSNGLLGLTLLIW